LSRPEAIDISLWKVLESYSKETGLEEEFETAKLSIAVYWKLRKLESTVKSEICHTALNNHYGT
jgi:hypothetical protein